jgi:hypothetical protein
MTDESSKTTVQKLPFIFRFAEPLQSCDAIPLRYDSARQISQVLIGGIWLDAVASTVSVDANTRITATKQETTDDT